MKDNAQPGLQVLKQVLTLKRVLLLILIGAFFGLLPLQFWSAALQSAVVRGVYFGITGCLSLVLTLWLLPLRKEGS
jgi:hypothetical protein